MPLRHGSGDQADLLRSVVERRHLRQDAPSVVGEIQQAHAVLCREAGSGQAVDPVPRARPADDQPGEAADLQHAAAVAHRLAFLAHAGLPRTVPFPGLGGSLRGVVAGMREPCRPFPAVVGRELRTRRRQALVQRREPTVGRRGPAVPGKVDRVFVAVGLDSLGEAIVRVGVAGVAARIAGPHVPLRPALRHPFRQHLACAARLRDAKGEDAGFVGIRHPRHRAEQRQAVRRIGDRAVDHPAHARLPEDRHPRHGVLDIPFQPVEIVGIKLEGEILRHWIVRRRPVRLAVPLVGAEVEAVFLLPQVVRGIHIAQERQLAVLL